jgi:hypothetical protein
MHLPENVKSLNSISKWQMGFNSAFKGLTDVISWNIRRRTVLVSAVIWRNINCYIIIYVWHNSPEWARASSFTRFLDHTQRRTTFGRTPLDEWSARRIDLQLTKNNIHNSQISMPPVGLEPTITADEWPQTCALNRASTGTAQIIVYTMYK